MIETGLFIIIGIYFSGTGNTKHCVEYFTSRVEIGTECFSIEDRRAVAKLNESDKHDTVVFGFPVYYSNIPKIAKDFIYRNKAAFKGKKVFIITTKGLFNAFAVGYAREIFMECGAEFIGSLQLNMPDNIRDMFVMEICFTKNYKKVIIKAYNKITKAAEKFIAGSLPKSGLNPFNYIIGFLLKILWFYPKTDKYIKAPKVNPGKCTGCGKCEKLCPMRNIKITDGKAVSGGMCTICYRCFNNCPVKALTVLGNKVYDQYTFDSANFK